MIREEWTQLTDGRWRFRIERQVAQSHFNAERIVPPVEPVGRRLMAEDEARAEVESMIRQARAEV